MTKKIYIEGMTCGHCKNHVETALKEVGGIKSVAVSLEEKFATVELAHAVEDAKLKAAVEEAGYKATRIE